VRYAYGSRRLYARIRGSPAVHCDETSYPVQHEGLGQYGWVKTASDGPDTVYRPMTNNKAERSLRPLVIKRKLSFGYRTQKGADVMSILLSVCLTTWWKNPENYYATYRGIIRKWQTV
jgi:hypothetical protein